MNEAENLLAGIILTDCQKGAIDAVMSNRSHITISGPAGSGKTFLTKILIKKIKQKSADGIILCAPTHQAKIIMSKMCGQSASTIHSILKIHPDTYEDVMEFKHNKDKLDLSEIRYIVCDEVSMIDDDLFKILVGCVHPQCQIIGIGDKFQIQPVRHTDGRLSPFFIDKRFRLFELKTIVRQKTGNPIIDVATNIRNGGWFSTKWDKSTGTGVIDVKSINVMLTKYLSKIKTPDDLLDYRVLAYTNEIVNRFNAVIRKHVYNTIEPFVDNEYIVLQEPLTETESVYNPLLDKYQDMTEILINNGEIVKIVEGSIVKSTKTVNLPTDGTFNLESVEIEIATFNVIRTQLDEEDGIPDPIEMTVVWDANSKVLLDTALAEAAGQYKQVSTKAAKTRMWKAFWDLKNCFTDTKSLGASTYHKSQGSTVIGACIYLGDMNHASFELQSQLAYVGCTRASKWVLYC